MCNCLCDLLRTSATTINGDGPGVLGDKLKQARNAPILGRDPVAAEQLCQLTMLPTDAELCSWVEVGRVDRPTHANRDAAQDGSGSSDLVARKSQLGTVLSHDA